MITKISYALIFSLFVAGCSGTKPDSDGLETSEDREVFQKNIYTSGPFVNSMTKGGLTSRSFGTKKAKELVGEYAKEVTAAPEDSKQRGEAFNKLIAAQRLSGTSTEKVYNTMKKIAAYETGDSAFLKNETAYLELALAGINNGDYSFSEFYLNDLLDSKNAMIKASALNAVGIIHFAEGREPEAVQTWQNALKAVGNFQAALLNLGFAYLMFGHFETAASYLGKVEEDWYAQSGQIVSFKNLGDNEKAASNCSEVLKDVPNHKQTLFNCGVYYWQIKKNGKIAKEYINKALKISGGPESWATSGRKVLDSIH